MLILAFLPGGWAVGVIWGARLIALSFAIHNMVQLYQMYQSTGDVIFLQEMLIQISAICTLGLIRIGPMEDLFAETAALKGIIAQMKAEGVPTSTTLNFLKTYGVGRAQQATQTLGYFKKYGLLDNQLLNLSQGFDRANIIAIENAYIKSLVKFTPQDTDAILILFKQTVGLGNASNLSNNIVALSNSGIVPSAYSIYGIVGTNGVSSAVIALRRGIPAPVMKRLGDLGIKTTDYERLGIKGKETAEGVAEAVEEAVRLSKYEEMSSGAVKGMFSKMSVDEWLRLEDLAHAMYNSFRTRVDDVAKIAKNIGWDESKIVQIKNHLFNEEHLFNDGKKRLFDPNYWQAEAWERLVNGKATAADKLLLNHELFESNYIKARNCTYEVAHEETNKLYNWSKEVFGE